MAHELTTGPEIVNAVVATPSTPAKPSSGKVDVFVAGAGTGGTITGISRAIKKKHNPDAIVVCVDPVCMLFSRVFVTSKLIVSNRKVAFSLSHPASTKMVPDPVISSRASVMTLSPTYSTGLMSTHG